METSSIKTGSFPFYCETKGASTTCHGPSLLCRGAGQSKPGPTFPASENGSDLAWVLLNKVEALLMLGSESVVNEKPMIIRVQAQ